MVDLTPITTKEGGVRHMEHEKTGGEEGSCIETRDGWVTRLAM